MRSILLAGLALGAMVAAAQAAEVKLGVAAPITGNSAAIGAQLKNGASQAVEDLNKAGTLKGTDAHRHGGRRRLRPEAGRLGGQQVRQ